jgi:alpha-1,2-mannosyltransferase
MWSWSDSRPWAQRVFVSGALAALAVHALINAFFRAMKYRDFDVHREFGRRFLTGEYLYGSGICHPYMPTAAMYFSPLALVDRGTGFMLRYAVAVACLWFTFRLLYRMVHGHAGTAAPRSFPPAVLTVLLAFQFVLQDLDDAGPHLILLMILVGGMYAVRRGRDSLGAVWFGLAIALKVTPALFLPFFLWKRRWRLAGLTAIAALGWIVMPMVWLGPATWWKHQGEWIEVSAGSFMGHETPLTVENEQRVNNQSLNQALQRYLVTYPEDHPARRSDSAYVPLLDLPPSNAKIVVIAAMFGLLAAFCWKTRHPYAERNDPDWVRDCSGVLILALLFCPVTWVQHLVWLVPALYLIAGKAMGEARLSAVAWGVLSVYVFLVVVLNYEVLGKQNFAHVMSYHPFTVAMLLVFLLVMLPDAAPRQPTYSRMSLVRC